MGATIVMTVEQMREKLREWNPSWNVDRFKDRQIVEIYTKERRKIVEDLLKQYPESTIPSRFV